MTLDGVIINCVVDGTIGNDAIIVGPRAIVVNTRITNTVHAATYGLDETASGGPSSVEDYNVFFSTTNAGDIRANTVDGGIHSYGDHANHIGATSDDGIGAVFNFEYRKEHDSTAVIMNWDE